MIKDTILRLLNSKNSDDILIGIELLIKESPKDILRLSTIKLKSPVEIRSGYYKLGNIYIFISYDKIFASDKYTDNPEEKDKSLIRGWRKLN